MKKINLKGLNEVLSEKELKNVMGGSYGGGGGTAGNCCYSGTVRHENGQDIYYENCGFTINYIGYLWEEFYWNQFDWKC